MAGEDDERSSRMAGTNTIVNTLSLMDSFTAHKYIRDHKLKWVVPLPRFDRHSLLPSTFRISMPGVSRASVS